MTEALHGSSALESETDSLSDPAPQPPSVRELALRFVDEKVARHEWVASTGRSNQSQLLPLLAAAGVLDLADIERVVTDWERLVEGYASSTKASRASEFRVFVTWLCETGRLDPSILQRLPKSSRAVGVPRPDDRIDVELVVAAAEPREQLIVALMGFCGLRRVEVARLLWCDVDLRRKLLLIHGKGGHERILDLRGAYDFVARARTHHARPEGAVVASRRRWPGGITVSKVWLDVRTALDRVGINANPKSLRSEAATRLAEAGATLEEVRAFLGHEHVDSVDAYLPDFLVDARRAIDGRSYSSSAVAHESTARGDRPPMSDSSWRYQRLDRILNSNLSPPTSVDLPVAELVEWYVDRKRHDWLPVTVERVERLLQDFASSSRGIDHESVNAWLTTGISRNTARFRLSVIRGFADDLVATGVLAADPTRAMRSPRKVSVVPRVLTGEQCEALLAATRNRTTSMVLSLVLCHAMTPAEVSRLNVEDLDMTALTIRRGGRSVPLALEAALAVRRHLAGIERTKGPLLTSRVTGERSNSDVVASTVSKAFKRLDMPGNATILRATCLGGFAASDAPFHAVRDAGGHADLRTTLRYVRPAAHDSGRQFLARVWPVNGNTIHTACFSLRESAELLGISTDHLRTLRRRLDITGESPTGPVLLSESGIATLRAHLNTHRRGMPQVVPADVVDEIVRLRQDNRSCEWIAHRFNREAVSPGNYPSWTAYRVGALCRNRAAQ